MGNPIRRLCLKGSCSARLAIVALFEISLNDDADHDPQSKKFA
jgi:hypothetical protein